MAPSTDLRLPAPGRVANGRLANLLVALHTGANTGYAIAPLERAFLEMARLLVGDDAGIHFAFLHLERGYPETLPRGFANVVALDFRTRSRERLADIAEYVGRHRIENVFAFDAPVSLPAYKVMRAQGVRRIISYQGAPVSSLQPVAKLLLKRVEVLAHRNRPDHFIFESEAMRRTATHGRGIRHRDTSVVYLGADAERFAPQGPGYSHAAFGIPAGRKIVVFAGHMEPRKGVRVLVESFVELVVKRGRNDLHLLVLGNRGAEAETFRPLYVDSPAAGYITFGGYRDDIPAIFASCDIGAIASTGWDSFTMSSVEMALSGLPLVVSDLQGLAETVAPGETGFTFPPGDARALADRIEQLADDPELRARMGKAARERALARHRVEQQVRSLAQVVSDVCCEHRTHAAMS